MSVSNIFITDDRASIISDTLVYMSTTPIGFCERKAYISHNKKFAITTRGLSDLCKISADTLIRESCANSAVLAAEHSLRCIDDSDLRGHSLQVNIVGWDEARGKMRAYEVRRLAKGGPEPVVSSELPAGLHVNPSMGPLPPLPPVITEQMMVKIAIAQQNAALKYKFNLCIGGLMHLTTLTRDGAVQKVACEYPDYKSVVHNLKKPETIKNIFSEIGIYDDDRIREILNRSDIMPEHTEKSIKDAA